MVDITKAVALLRQIKGSYGLQLTDAGWVLEFAGEGSPRSNAFADPGDAINHGVDRLFAHWAEENAFLNRLTAANVTLIASGRRPLNPDEYRKQEAARLSAERAESAHLALEAKAKIGTPFDLGIPLDFYGVDANCFKLDDDVFEAVEDPDNGYRSYLGSIELTETADRRFPARPLDLVTVEEAPEIDGYMIVSEADGHVWLRIGTEDFGDYYPTFVFSYHPRNPDRQLPLFDITPY